MEDVKTLYLCRCQLSVCSGKRLITTIISGNFLEVQIASPKFNSHWNQWVFSDSLKHTSVFTHTCNVFSSWKEIGVNLSTVTPPLHVEALLHWENPYIVMFQAISMVFFWERLNVFIFMNFWLHFWEQRKCKCIPLFLACFWECPVDRSRSRSEPTTQMKQAKPSPLDSCLARHIFFEQELVFIHEEI